MKTADLSHFLAPVLLRSTTKNAHVPASRYLDKKYQAEKTRLNERMALEMRPTQTNVAEGADPIAAPASLVQKAREQQGRIDASYEHGMDITSEITKSASTYYAAKVEVFVQEMVDDTVIAFVLSPKNLVILPPGLAGAAAGNVNDALVNLARWIKSLL